jgi:tRNA A37 threonylcarbamoyladenosine biosynthesis protein TsaE
MQSQNTNPTLVNTSQCLIDHLKKNGPTLILLSGTPGSGKSTLARTIAQQLGTCKHFEADQYFEHSNGYHFNANKLGEAHAECQRNAEFYINKGYYVVVANTFTKDWEFKAYERIKKDFILVQLTGTYDNVHGCPAFAVERMKENLDQRKRKPDFICDPNINKNT